MLTEKGASLAKSPRRMAPYLRAALSPYNLPLIPQTALAPIVQLHPGGTQHLTVDSLASRKVYHICEPQYSILKGLSSVNTMSGTHVCTCKTLT